MSFSEWKKNKLVDITEKIGSGATPRGGSSVYLESGIPFIRSQNVYNCEFSEDGLVYIDDESAKKLDNVKLFKNDIILNITGDSVARCTILPEKYIGGRVNQHVAIIRTNSEILNPQFLKYYLVSPDMQSHMLSLAKMGATRAALTKGMIESFEIPRPPIPEQKAIAHILSTLDEKIEVNNKINKTLENMAQSIFKEWFVEFEFPNEDGEPYKSSGGEMIESELGMIPKGWEVGVFKDYINNILGGDWGKESLQGNYIKEVYCLRGADIPEVQMGRKGNLPKRYILEKNHKNKKLNYGDIVVEISGGSPIQSTGRITYITNEMLSKYDCDFVCTNFCRAISLKNKENMEYFYLFWKYLYDLNVFFQYENGTTGIKNLDINTFIENYNIVKPNSDIIFKFNVVINNLIRKIQLNGDEVIKLSEIRDSLLPKLMSGEIRVPF